MSELQTLVSRRQCLSALAATAATVGTITAQSPEDKNIRSVSRWFVKPERIGDFTSIVKEFNPLFAKGGRKSAASWWRSETGPTEFVVVSDYSKWAEVNTPEALKEVQGELAPLRARLRQCIERSQRIISSIMPEYSIRTSRELPSLLAVTKRRIRPEHVEDYLNAVKTDVMPAMKKAEIPMTLLTRTIYGEPGPAFRRATSVKSWASLDEPAPLVAAMGGAAAMQKLNARLAPWIVEVESNIYSHLSELDYKASV